MSGELHVESEVDLTIKKLAMGLSDIVFDEAAKRGGDEQTLRLCVAAALMPEATRIFALEQHLDADQLLADDEVGCIWCGGSAGTRRSSPTLAEDVKRHMLGCEKFPTREMAAELGEARRQLKEKCDELVQAELRAGIAEDESARLRSWLLAAAEKTETIARAIEEGRALNSAPRSVAWADWTLIATTARTAAADFRDLLKGQQRAPGDASPMASATSSTTSGRES